MTEGLRSLKGKSVQTAIGILGVPSEEKVIAGNKIITWKYGRDESYTLPTVNTSFGSVAGKPASMTSYGTQTTNLTFSCRIDLMTSKLGIAEKFEYEGDVEGCQKYAKRLKEIAQPQ